MVLRFDDIAAAATTNNVDNNNNSSNSAGLLLPAVAGAVAPFDLASCSPREEDFARRVYVVAGPILLTLGLCGNFAIIAILSKQRFRPFPITTLIKSHAIVNIFCLFIGLFLGNYFRALSNFNLQHQFGIWGCRIHLTLTYALSYISSWHYVAMSYFRVLMATSPSFYTSRYCRILVRGAICVILTLALLASGHIFWSISFQRNDSSSTTATPQPGTNNNNNNNKSVNFSTKLPNNATKSCRPSICTVRDDAESFYSSWKVIDLAAAIIIPFGLVLINMIALPLIFRSRSAKNSSSSDLASPLSSSPPCYYRQSRRRRSSSVENMASNLATMLYYQDVLFIVLSLPLLIYLLLLHFPRPMSWLLSTDGDDDSQEQTLASIVDNLRLVFPFANLLQYSINIIQFPVYALCNSQRRPQSSCISIGGNVPNIKKIGPKTTRRVRSATRQHDQTAALPLVATTNAAGVVMCSSTTSEEALQSSPLRLNESSSGACNDEDDLREAIDDIYSENFLQQSDSAA